MPQKALSGTEENEGEQNRGLPRFPAMSRFNHYRPRYDVALVVLLVAIVSIAGLFILEIENPRLSHFPSPETHAPETHAAAKEAGARVTPSKPEETEKVEMRQPTVVDKKTAE
jgi:hypothetical protein